MKQPSIFIPHGGGPCFFMDPPPDDPQRWVGMENYLRSIPSLLPGKPDAMVVVSAHWEMPLPTVLSAAHPGLLYDYNGFPPHTYRLTYPAPGAPALGVRVRTLLDDVGIASAEDARRNFDHGIFIPLKVSFPDADIPILQLSLKTGLDPAFHIAVGRALGSLRDDNILVVGSGLSFHNLGSLGDPRAAAPSHAFDSWLVDVLCDGPVDARDASLADWTRAPGARICHPREEHLLPLMVAAGAGAGEKGRQAYSGEIWGKAVSAFHFGND
jgi:aromatic ring-opening dioxygenase catalytic subunit (LigB family)